MPPDPKVAARRPDPKPKPNPLLPGISLWKYKPGPTIRQALEQTWRAIPGYRGEGQDGRAGSP